MPDFDLGTSGVMADPLADADRMLVRQAAGTPGPRVLTVATLKAWIWSLIAQANHGITVSASGGGPGSDAAAFGAALAACPAGGVVRVVGAIDIGTSVYTLPLGVAVAGTHGFVGKGLPPAGGAARSLAAKPGGSAILSRCTGATPLLTLSGSNSVTGITFHRPDQNYAATTLAGTVTTPYAIAGGPGVCQVRVSNCCFVGWTSCIQLRGTGPTAYTADARVDFNYGYPLGGRFLDLAWCLDIPRVANNHVNPGAGASYLGQVAPSFYTALPAALCDAVVAAGAAAFSWESTDEFVSSSNFVFGCGVGFRSRGSYGQHTNCTADMVRVGFDIEAGEAVKYVTVMGGNVIPSAGPAPRYAVRFGGADGTLKLFGLHALLGTNGYVPSSSSPSAAAVVRVDGTGAQRVLSDALTSAAYAGGFTAEFSVTNGSATVLAATYAAAVSPPPPPPGVTPLSDTFTGAAGDLSSHTSDSGHTWTLLTTVPPQSVMLSGTGTAYSLAAAGAQVIYKSSFTPPSADTSYTVTYDPRSAIGEAGLFARFTGAAPGTDAAGYGVRYSPANGVQLYKLAAGVFTQLGANYAHTLVAGDAITIAPAGSTIDVRLNGVTVISEIDGAISGAGTCALWADDGAGSSATGVHFAALTSA